MSYENILVKTEGQVQILTISRVRQMNALNRATIAELSTALKKAEENENIRAVIITGDGEKAFVAGADIKEFADFNVEQGQELSQVGHDTLFTYIEHMTTPCIAAVNGFALGGGLELAMSCHMRIASDNAKMGLPEVTLGVIPGYGGTQRLAQLVGKGKAMEMVLTGGMITAENAYNWGLVNRVTFAVDLKAEALKLANKIAANSPAAIGKAIEVMNAGFGYEKAGLNAEIEGFGWCFGTEDFKEGTTAFIEKRKPNFTGK